MTVEVLTRKDGKSTAVVSCRDTQGAELNDYKFWLESMGSQSQPAELCRVGAKVKIETKLQPGSAKPGGGNYPDEYFITSATSVSEAFNDDRPQTYPESADPRQDSIEAQVAFKGAIELAVAYLNAVGAKEFDVNMVTGWSDDFRKHLWGAKR